MPRSALAIDIEDYEGNRVILTKKKLREKAEIHPVLKSPAFLKHVEKALSNPTNVYKDKAMPTKKRCYYWRYSTHRYAKVIVWIYSNPRNIVSAYDVDFIREQLYMSLEIL